MKSISKMLIAIVVLLSVTNSFAQIKNTKSESIKISGNCRMCKSRIEKAGSEKDISKVIWNQKTQMALITFDSIKTTKKQILDRIAAVGHDSELSKAKQETYDDLPGCCQYDRASITQLKPNVTNPAQPKETSKEKTE